MTFFFPSLALLDTVTGKSVPVFALLDTERTAVIIVEPTTDTSVNRVPFGPLMVAPGAKPDPVKVTSVLEF